MFIRYVSVTRQAGPRDQVNLRVNIRRTNHPKNSFIDDNTRRQEEEEEKKKKGRKEEEDAGEAGLKRYGCRASSSVYSRHFRRRV